MQVQLNIPFEQLIKIVKQLPKVQLTQLKTEIEKQTQVVQEKKNTLESLLMNGPVASKKDIEIIEQNRQSINKWRTK